MTLASVVLPLPDSPTMLIITGASLSTVMLTLLSALIDTFCGKPPNWYSLFSPSVLRMVLIGQAPLPWPPSPEPRLTSARFRPRQTAAPDLWQRRSASERGRWSPSAAERCPHNDRPKSVPADAEPAAARRSGRGPLPTGNGARTGNPAVAPTDSADCQAGLPERARRQSSAASWSASACTGAAAR